MVAALSHARLVAGNPRPGLRSEPPACLVFFSSCAWWGMQALGQCAPRPTGGGDPPQPPEPARFFSAASACRARWRAAQPSLTTCGERLVARLPGGTSLVTVVPAPT